MNPMSSEVFSVISRINSGKSIDARRGSLRYGNSTGDPSTTPRCGARTRRGTACRCPAVWSTRSDRYTRCRIHGGASTGPKTLEGLARSRKANWKHGAFSADAKLLAAFHARVRRSVLRSDRARKRKEAPVDFQTEMSFIQGALTETIAAEIERQRPKMGRASPR